MFEYLDLSNIIEPTPVLQELVQDLENKLCMVKGILADCGEYAPDPLTEDLKKDIQLLESVLNRVAAQQELIDLRNQCVCLN
tara:strand:+ start:36 stop:281 length:246 start_codon:yes stop_codon:yes gene_type:complete